MKIICLNTYGGIVYEPLMAFVKQHRDTTDVFSFQEIISANAPDLPLQSNKARTNLLQELQTLLPDFSIVYAPAQDNYDAYDLVDLPLEFGPATFVRNTWAINAQESFFLYRDRNQFKPRDFTTLGTTAIITALQHQDGRTVTVCNAHGTSEPADKRDSPDRLEQSRRILDRMGKYNGPKTIMGDFNLYPDTESVAMIKQAGYLNLIDEYEIEDTRGSLVPELFPHYADGPYGFQLHADHFFVTPDITVNTFTVPDARVSDHLPMIAEITLPQ